VRNVEAQLADPASMLHFYQRVLALRRATPALHAGGFELVGHHPGQLAFVRSSGAERWLVSINPTEVPWPVGDAGMALDGAIVLATDPALEGRPVGATLPAAAAVVARLA
jgi:alpha-glucosidase